MIAPREAVITALLAKLRTLTTFTTVAREWKGIDRAEQIDELDALFLLELPEKHIKAGRGMPSKVDLPFDVVLVLKNPDEGTPAGTKVNPILDLLDQLFYPTPAAQMAGSREQLGGLVYDVWIEGTIQKNYSYLGGRASLVVAPLHVRTYNGS